MSKQSPERMLISKKISLNGPLRVRKAASIKDKIPVKDSTIYQFQSWEYLVKKQNVRNSEEELLLLLDELTSQGWELIKSQPINLGFYVFKKMLK